MPSKLEQMQLQLRQKLLQEKEEKLVKIYNTNQKKALDRLTRSSEMAQRNRDQLYSAPPSYLSKTSSTSIQVSSTSPRNLPIKQGSPGVDRSRPLAPIQKNQKNSFNSNPVSSSHANNGISVHSNPSKTTFGRVNKKPQPRIDENQKVHCEIKETSPAAKVKEYHLEKHSEKPARKNAIDSHSRPKVKAAPSTHSVKNDKTIVKQSKPVHHSTTTVNSRSAAAATTSTVKKTLSEVPPGFARCQICNRNFSDDRIEKHRSICTTVSQKKRKVFDATKMRVEGTEAENFVKKGKGTKEVKPKKSNWRSQHESFLESIRQAKAVQKHLAAGGKLSDLPPPKPSENPDYVPCPHCGRKFNEGAAERHIPKCKNIISNKPRKK